MAGGPGAAAASGGVCTSCATRLPRALRRRGAFSATAAPNWVTRQASGKPSSGACSSAAGPCLCHQMRVDCMLMPCNDREGRERTQPPNALPSMHGRVRRRRCAAVASKYYAAQYHWSAIQYRAGVPEEQVRKARAVRVGGRAEPPLLRFMWHGMVSACCGRSGAAAAPQGGQLDSGAHPSLLCSPVCSLYTGIDLKATRQPARGAPCPPLL